MKNEEVFTQREIQQVSTGEVSGSEDFYFYCFFLFVLCRHGVQRIVVAWDRI
jgi:hypothetical protein